MGEVIRFPEETAGLRGGRYVDAASEPATVIILPVVRIERAPDDNDHTDGSVAPSTGNGPNRGRRRRLSR
jgi:hypothetical protein